jgi:hypothetical protein
MMMVSPVIQLAASDARKAPVEATSDGSPMRPRGVTGETAASWFLPQRLGQAGADDAWGDGVDPHPRRELESELFGQVDQPGLGRVVDAEVGSDPPGQP